MLLLSVDGRATGAPPDGTCKSRGAIGAIVRDMGLESARGRAVRSLSRNFQTIADPAAKARVTALKPQRALPRAGGELRFPISLESRRFYRQFWPETTAAEWNDWR